MGELPDFMLGVSTSVTVLNTGHGVSPEQYEFCPGPNPEACDQALRHELELSLVNIHLSSAYYFSDSFGVSASLPLRIVGSKVAFLDASDSPILGFSSMHHRDETLVGVGDVNLGFLARNSGSFAANASWFGLLNIGISLPTGNQVENPQLLGQWKDEHQHMFFGRGTAAPTFSASGSLRLSWGFIEGSFMATVPVVATASKEYTPPDGHTLNASSEFDGYDVGQYMAPTELLGSLGVGSDFETDDWSITGLVESRYESQATWQGVKSPNTGRTELTLGVRSSLILSDGFMVELSVKVPVWVAMPTEESQVQMPFILGFACHFTGNA